MKDENAVNFLLYSYFEVTLDNNEQELIDAAIARAYRDASSRVLSITDEPRFYSGEDQEKKSCKKAATEYLQGKIGELESAKEYDVWFYEVCHHLATEIYKEAKNAEGKQAFNFGHAQKWVNMTMKYLCVIKNVFKVYHKDIFSWLTTDLEKDLHIPVDSYIMEAAAFKGKISEDKDLYGLSIKLPNNQNGLGAYSAAKSWSKWDRGNYKQFTEQLDGKFDEINPLDWEGPAWIEIAKIRKEKEKEREQKKEKNFANMI